ncbi:nitrogen fixation protein NifQ [Arcobacter sp.]|uniref:nitrogen fixation protein NifQ n=1 Tax=Arcobacter sp. TaxID=1872629 RepID=UPI003D148338
MRDLELMEKEVLDLLIKHANNEVIKTTLAPLIAKTSIEMGHLYSDLGLASREEMGKLMSANFSSLAKLKPSDVRWKKYLYDCIGKTAPACAKCNDISNCFHCSLAS